MNVTLLGTGAAEGWPGLFCRCKSCRTARERGGKNLRTRSSALIDTALKIDFPPDTLHQIIANNIDLCGLEGLLFTHAHDDHFCGAELQYMGPYFVTAPLPMPLPVYGPPEVIGWMETHLRLERLPITLHTLAPWETVCISHYHITPLPAQHDPSITCFNYIIEGPDGATLLYASDTGWYEEPAWCFLEGVALDGIVVECQKGQEEGGYPGHLSIGDVVRLRERLMDNGSLAAGSPMAVTHLSHLSGMMHEEWEARLAPHQIQTGFDGMQFAVPPPTSAVRLQRRLNGRTLRPRQI